MSGQYNTNIQTLILSEFPNTVYIRCCAYNLNLVILNTAKSFNKMQTFLIHFKMYLYNFIHVSTPWWALLALRKKVESKIQKKKHLKKFIHSIQYYGRHANTP